jgi:outer membrane protein
VRSATARAWISLTLGTVSIVVPQYGWAQVSSAVETKPPAAPVPVVSVPGAQSPPVIEQQGPPGPPVYRPALPAGTPTDQVERDAAEPVTRLDEALQRAYWTNPSLLAARASTRSIDYRVPQARAAYGPSLGYSASYQYRDDTFDQPVGNPVERSGWTSAANAVLSQPLFTFGRMRAGEDSARAQVAFQRATLASAEQDTLLRTINAYVSVLRDRAGVGINESQVDLLAQEYGDTQIRLEQHDATSADYQQVQSRLELARAQLAAARSNAVSSDAIFLQYVGSPAGELMAPNPLAMPVQTLEDAYEYAEAHNPVIASAYARERNSRAELARAKADLLPRVDLRGEGVVGTVSPYSDSLREKELLGSITLSGTIDAGLRQARIGEAAAANDADWRLIDDALRQNRAELADAWSGWKGLTTAVERLQISVQAAELALLGGQQQQRAGLRTTTEILDLARDLLQVRSSLNSSMANAFIQQARVLAALGALTHERLLQGTPSYDPQDHYGDVVHKGDVPLLTPMVRALDSALTDPPRDRPLRDPAAPLAVGEAPAPPIDQAAPPRR